VGGHSAQDESNGNGDKLINFAVQWQVMIGGKLFLHKRTWRSSDGRIVNQTDNVLIDQIHHTKCINATSLRGANAQDHTLWRAQFGKGYGPVARQTTT
jgi:hypothetical protein